MSFDSGSRTKFAPTSNLRENDDNDYDDDDESESSLFFRLFVTSKKLLKLAIIDEYMNVIQEIGRIEIDKSNWRNGKCLCKKFQKEYICEHVVGLSMAPSAESIQLSDGKKKKRGPKKKGQGGKALIVD